MTPEDSALVALAIGRIFLITSRQTRQGDIAEYERCRKIILDRIEAPADRSPNYARDRLKGAQGD